MKKYELTKENKMLIKEAENVIVKSKPVNLVGTGQVGAALITSRGNVFRGVCVGFHCGIESCGEYQAVGDMISNGEKKIKVIVAVHSLPKGKYKVVPPCGKCREMLHELGDGGNIEVIISKSKKVKLKDLLPIAWDGTIEK